MADEWDIDGEENAGWNEDADSHKKGKDDYMIVIRYNNLKPTQFRPQHQMLDPSTGKPLMSSYNKAQPRTEDATKDSVWKKKVMKWTTKNEDLQKLDATHKALCNSLKAWLNKSEVAVYYHNANVDECSEFGGAHLHILYHSPTAASGFKKSLFDITAYRNLRKRIYENGGYCKSQGVRNLEGAARHFCTAPRVYMGTNLAQYYKVMLNCIAPPTPGTVHPPLTECLETDPEEVEETETVVREWSGFEDEDPGVTLKRNSEWDEEEWKLQPPNKKAMKVEETDMDRIIRLCTMLAQRWNAYNIADMFKACSELAEDARETKYRDLWFRLSSRSKVKSALDNVKLKLEAMYMYKKFEDLVEEYCTRPEDANKYHSPEQSYEIFMQWCHDQGISSKELITNLTDVMNRKLEKINTVCFIGQSNSGKTVMISNPLRTIARFTGDMGNRGSGGDFVFMECINKRLIVIDECIMDPKNLEDMKKLLGGEEMLVQVKFQGHGKLSRTPCIITGNKPPWVLDVACKEPLQNRMFYYETRAIDDLKECRQMSPKMWWYLLQAKDCIADAPLQVPEAFKPIPSVDYSLEEHPLV